jgi:hypothetical protein
MNANNTTNASTTNTNVGIDRRDPVVGYRAAAWLLSVEPACRLFGNPFNGFGRLEVDTPEWGVNLVLRDGKLESYSSQGDLPVGVRARFLPWEAAYKNKKATLAGWLDEVGDIAEKYGLLHWNGKIPAQEAREFFTLLQQGKLIKTKKKVEFPWGAILLDGRRAHQWVWDSGAVESDGTTIPPEGGWETVRRWVAAHADQEWNHYFHNPTSSAWKCWIAGRSVAVIINR